MQKGEVKDPVKVLLLCLFTCGIYNLIWIIQTVKEVNAALGEERFNLVKELGLSVITCGAWGVYFLWRFCEAVVDVQVAANVEPEMDAPILFLMNILYIGPFFIQKSLNNAWENGSAAAAPHVEGDSWDDRMDE